MVIFPPCFIWDKIQTENLLKYRGLRFVTSSIAKRELTMKAEENHEKTGVAMKAEKNGVSCENQETERIRRDDPECHEQKNIGYQISASAAYQIAASAASYLHSHTRIILPFKSSQPESDKDSSEAGSGRDCTTDMINSDVAALMATTDSVTAVVAAKEEVKQAVADDLNSTHSSPCEWFICDNDQSATRFFVVQVGNIIHTLISFFFNIYALFFGYVVTGE